MKEKNKIVDKAWDTLYLRMEDSGLLQGQPHKKVVNLQRRAIWWMAAAVIALVGLGAAFFATPSDSIEMLAIYNEKDAPTLYATLEDGSAVYLGEQTSLQYPQHFADAKREVQLDGKAYFSISKKEQCPFIIDTKLATVEIVGTTFDIESNGDRSFHLAVKSGKVKVTRKSDANTLFIEAGEAVYLNATDFYKMFPDNLLFDKYLKKIRFKDQRLIDVANAINELSDSTQLKITTAVEDKLITATFANESVYSIAELICITLNLKSTIQNDVITISNKN